jgi:hypothetical protein
MLALIQATIKYSRGSLDIGWTITTNPAIDLTFLADQTT